MSEKVTLYDLYSEHEALADILEEAQGEITEEQEQKLTILFDAISKKVDNTGGFISFVNSQIDHCKEMEETYKAKRKALENKLQQLKYYLGKFLAIKGLKNIKGDAITISNISNKALEIIEPDLVPLDCKKFVVELPYDFFKENREILEPYLKKAEIDKKKLTEDTAGCGLIDNYNIKIYGLNKKGAKNE